MKNFYKRLVVLGIVVFWILIVAYGLVRPYKGDLIVFKNHKSRSFELTTPLAVLEGVPFTVGISVPDPAPYVLQSWNHTTIVWTVAASAPNQPNITGPSIIQPAVDRTSSTQYTVSGVATATDVCSTATACHAQSQTLFKCHRYTEVCNRVNVIPSPLVFFPPLLTVVVALVSRQCAVALFCGIWSAGFFVYDYNPLIALLKTLDTILPQTLSNPVHTTLLAVICLFGGLLGVVSKSGGLKSLGRVLIRPNLSRKQVMASCWVSCVLLCLDDVTGIQAIGSSFGSTMSSVGVSPQKFAFIAHATCSSIASITPISTVTLFYLGLIQRWRLPDTESYNAYVFLLETTPYRFFPIIMGLAVLAVTVIAKDIAIMFRVEHECMYHRRSVIGDKGGGGAITTPYTFSPIEDDERESFTRESGRDLSTLDPHEAVMARKAKWYNVVVVIAMLLIAIPAAMYFDGHRNVDVYNHNHPNKPNLAKDFATIFNHCQIDDALLWSVWLTCIVTVAMPFYQGILNMSRCINAFTEGIKSVIPSVAMLVLAWGFGDALDTLQFNNAINHFLQQSVPCGILPTIMLLCSFLLSFGCGSGLGTAAILFPFFAHYLATPVHCKHYGGVHPIEYSDMINKLCVSSIISGSVFGDIVSPWSQTTMLTASNIGCTSGNHVTSSFTYVVVVAVASLITTLVAGYSSMPIWVLVIVIMIVLWVILFIFGLDAATWSKNGTRSLWLKVWENIKPKAPTLTAHHFHGGRTEASSTSDPALTHALISNNPGGPQWTSSSPLNPHGGLDNLRLKQRAPGDLMSLVTGDDDDMSASLHSGTASSPYHGHHIPGSVSSQSISIGLGGRGGTADYQPIGSPRSNLISNVSSNGSANPHVNTMTAMFQPKSFET